MSRRAVRRWTAGATMLAVSLVTSAAAAAPTNTPGVVAIDVLSISSKDAVDEASALTDAFGHALLEADGVTNTKGNTYALEAVALTADCDEPMNPACAPKLAAEIKRKEFIYGTLRRGSEGKLIAIIAYYSHGKVKKVVRTYDAGPAARDGTSPSLKRLALETVFELRGEVPEGKVQIVVKGPAQGIPGHLYDGNHTLGRWRGGSRDISLPLGRHRLILVVPGYRPAEEVVEVTLDGRQRVEMTPEPSDRSGSANLRVWTGLGLVAAGAGFLTAGVVTSIEYQSLHSDARFTEYRQQWDPSVSDTCAEAKNGSKNATREISPSLTKAAADICTELDSKRVLQFVFYGVGGALVGTGAVLLLTAGSHDRGRASSTRSPFALQLAPNVGPHGAFLSLAGRF